MNKAKSPIDQIKAGLGIALLAAVTGCAGWVNEDAGYGYGGYGYDGFVMAPEPDCYVFGNNYGWGRNEYRYGHRGFESRRAAHFGRGGYHGGGHGGGGYGGGGHGGHGGGGHGR